jgi:hypothetical protein
VPANDALPFATATIARLCMLQGKLERAEALYRQLLQERPKDPRLIEGLGEVLRRKGAPASTPGGDQVRLRIEGEALVCSWTITEEGQERARRVLGGHGELILRLMSFPIDPRQPAKDQPLDRLSGDLVLPSAESVCLLAASVGLIGADGRFVSITHCTYAIEERPR